MRTPRRVALLLSFLLIVGLAIELPAARGAELQLPIFLVKATGPTQQQAGALAKQLNLLGNPRNRFGGLVYMAPNYGNLPTRQLEGGGDPDEGEHKITHTGLNLPAIQKIQVPSGEEVAQRVGAALGGAGLDPAKFLMADGSVRPSIGHSTFTFQRPQDEASSPPVPITTELNFRFSLNAGTPDKPQMVPLVGPGAQVKVVENPQGQVTALQYELRRLSRGPVVNIVDEQTALDRCGLALGQRVAAAALSVKLVYYAPPLEPTRAMPFPGSIGRVSPWYECDGSVLIGDDTVRARSVFVPAAVGSLHAQAQLSITKNTSAEAAAVVSGGTQPYSFYWSSSTGSISPAQADDGSLIDYEVMPKEEGFPPVETACVLVTDANGLTSTACDSAQIDGTAPAGPPPAPSRSRIVGRVDFGTEYLGTSAHLIGLADLSGSAPNAGGFDSRMRSSATSQFFWAETNAWERDFKQPGIGGGQDSSYVDDVDVVFYTGHANENGFSFSSNRDDNQLRYSDAQWGDRDLEWIALAACLILNRASVGGLDWAGRWGGSFQGLHMILSYATVSSDNTIEGDHFADYMTRTPFLWWNNPMKVRDAWVQTAIDSQPSTVTWAFMGPLGRNGLSDYDDFFWNKGATGPDIRGADLTGWYQVQGPS